MKNFLSLLLFFLLTVPAGHAQTKNAVLKGIVVDAATGDPLVGALVLVDSTRHGTANAKGEFTVTGLPMREANVNISYLGYRTVDRKVKINKATMSLGTVRMHEEGNTIEKVEVVGTSTTAIQKGDTTQYNASAFKTNPDADAGDLANKMPGITVEDGKVQSQGEDVTRVYVDGKLFYGDDPMAALRNLPASAVESIQTFDELSDEAKFIGYDDGQTSKALNIVTKHKVNRSTTGRLEAGYGMELDKNIDGKYQSRYIVGGNINTFTERNRWSVNGTTNNINRTRVTMSDDGGGGFGGSSGMNTINSFGLNYAGEWGKQRKTKFTGGYMYSNRHSKRETERIQDYFPTEQFESRIYQDTSLSKSNNYNHNFFIRLETQPDTNNRILFTPNASFRNNDSWNHRMASNVVTGGEAEQNSYTNTLNTSDGNSYNVGGNLIWTRRLGKKAGRALTTSFRGSLSDNSSDAWQVDTTDNTTDETWLKTLSRGWNRNVTGRLTYAEPLSKSSRILFNYRISYEHSKSEKLAYDFLIDEAVPDTTLSNIFTRNYLTNSGGIGYSFRKGNSRLSVGVDYEAAELKKEETFPGTLNLDRTFYSWEPSVQFRYELDRSKNLRIRYNGSAGLPSIEQLQNVIDNSNPLQLTAGNPFLKQSYTHRLTFHYFATNIEKSTNLFLMLNARTTRNSVAYRTQFFERDTVLTNYNGFQAQKGSQLRTPVNLNGYYSLSTMVGYSLPLNFIRSKLNLSGNYSFTRSPSYSGTELNHATSNNIGARIGISSNVSENVDFDISSATSYSYVSNSAKTDTKYISENVTARINVIFLGGFVFNTDISYRYNHNASTSGFTQSYCLWNAGIGRKFLRRRTAEFRITMYDILKQNKNLQHTIGDNYIQDTWTNTIGRYLMATLSFRFNSMNSLSKSANRDRNDAPEGGRRGFDGPRGGGYRGGYGGGRHF